MLVHRPLKPLKAHGCRSIQAATFSGRAAKYTASGVIPSSD
jgi:hypothetical protein